MKKIYSDIGQQPGTKSGRLPADKPVINRLSTAGFVLPSVTIGFPFVLASGGSFMTVSSMPWGIRGSVVSWGNRPIGAPSYPAPPRLAAPLPCCAPPRPDPPVVCPGFGFDNCKTVFCVFAEARIYETRKTQIRSHINSSAAQSWAPRCFRWTGGISSKGCLGINAVVLLWKTSRAVVTFFH